MRINLFWVVKNIWFLDLLSGGRTVEHVVMCGCHILPTEEEEEKEEEEDDC